MVAMTMSPHTSRWSHHVTVNQIDSQDPLQGFQTPCKALHRPCKVFHRPCEAPHQTCKVFKHPARFFIVPARLASSLQGFSSTLQGFSSSLRGFHRPIVVGLRGWFGREVGGALGNNPPTDRCGATGVVRARSVEVVRAWRFFARPPSCAPDDHRSAPLNAMARRGAWSVSWLRGDSMVWGISERFLASGWLGAVRWREAKRDDPRPPSSPWQHATRSLWSSGAQEGGPRDDLHTSQPHDATSRANNPRRSRFSPWGGCSPKPHRPPDQTTLEAPPRATPVAPQRSVGCPPKPHRPPDQTTATRPHHTPSQRAAPLTAGARPARSSSGTSSNKDPGRWQTASGRR
jgi:hypothetical protein